MNSIGEAAQRRGRGGEGPRGIILPTVLGGKCEGVRDWLRDWLRDLGGLASEQC